MADDNQKRTHVSEQVPKSPKAVSKSGSNNRTHFVPGPILNMLEYSQFNSASRRKLSSPWLKSIPSKIRVTKWHSTIQKVSLQNHPHHCLFYTATPNTTTLFTASAARRMQGLESKLQGWAWRREMVANKTAPASHRGSELLRAASQ